MNNTDQDIMKFERVLPSNFNGIFQFTNPSKEDFIGKWNSREYLFPAQSTTPMIITDESPLQIQHIRKKFAKDLAEREFYKSKSYKVMSDQEGKPGNRVFNSIHQAATYTLKDLEPYIQECLVPMKPAEILSKESPRVDVEANLSRNDEGQLNSEAIDSKTSLKQKALQA